MLVSAIYPIVILITFLLGLQMTKGTNLKLQALIFTNYRSTFIFPNLIFKVIDYCERKSKGTRPMHQRTDAHLYPPEGQLTKASKPSFDLEGETKVKSDIRKFLAHDILQVGFTLQTSLAGWAQGQI